MGNVTDAAPTIRLPGVIDIVTANQDGSSATVLLGVGGGAFAPPVNYATGLQPTSVAVGDVNGDGFPDIVVSSGGNPYGGVGDNTVTVLLGNGSGGFTPASGSPITIATGGVRPYGVAVADIDGDGFADIVTTNYGNSTLSILKSNGNGTFQSPVTVILPAGANPGFLKLADVNGDGKPDIVESNFGTGTVGVLLNDGHGGFSAPTYTNVGNGPAGIAVGDINGDGFPDIVVGNTGDNTVSVLLNNGHGGFTAQTPVTLASGAIPLNVALGDLNGDGKLDMVVDDIQDDTVVVLLGNGLGGLQPRAPLHLAPAVPVPSAQVHNPCRSSTSTVTASSISLPLPIKITSAPWWCFLAMATAASRVRQRSRRATIRSRWSPSIWSR
jgi:hypothetical protein